MNISQLIYFCELAHTEHYPSASENLGIAQSSLSRSIAALEEELDIILFEKSGRNIHLTKYGKAYLKYAEQAISALETGKEQVRSMADPYSGEIHLGLIYSLGPKIIPEIIRQFTAIEENKRLKIRLTQASTPELIQKLIDDACDLILCSPAPAPVQDVKFTNLLNRKIVAVVSNSNPISSRSHLTMTELSKYPLIISTEQIDFLREQFKCRNLPLNLQCVIQGECAAAGLAEVNYGIAVLNDAVAYDDMDVTAIPISDLENGNFPLYLAQYTKRWHSPAVNRFYRFIKDFQFTFQLE